MPKKYLRKNGVAERYGVTPRSVEEMVKDRRLRPPDLYNGRFPLWDENKLDADDRKATKATREARAARREAEEKATASS